METSVRIQGKEEENYGEKTKPEICARPPYLLFLDLVLGFSVWHSEASGS